MDRIVLAPLRVREPLYTPVPRYRIAVLGQAASIQLHRHTIAHSNIYDRNAAGYCIRLVEIANQQSEVRAALKALAIAVLTLQNAIEARGQSLPQPVVDAKDRAFRALNVLQP